MPCKKAVDKPKVDVQNAAATSPTLLSITQFRGLSKATMLSHLLRFDPASTTMSDMCQVDLIAEHRRLLTATDLPVIETLFVTPPSAFKGQNPHITSHIIDTEPSLLSRESLPDLLSVTVDPALVTISQMVFKVLHDNARVLPGLEEAHRTAVRATGVIRATEVEYLVDMPAEVLAILLCLDGIGKIDLRKALAQLTSLPPAVTVTGGRATPVPPFVQSSCTPDVALTPAVLPIPVIITPVVAPSLDELPPQINFFGDSLPLHAADPINLLGPVALPPTVDPQTSRNSRIQELKQLMQLSPTIWSPDQLADYINHGSVTSVPPPPPPPSVCLPPQLALSASANQGATRLQGNLKIGVITSAFVASIGVVYDKSVVNIVVSALLRRIHGSTTKGIGNITEADVTAIVQFQGLTPALLERLSVNVSNPAIYAESTPRDYLMITTFLQILQQFMPSTAFQQTTRLWEYIKGGNLVRKLFPSHLVEVFLHSLTNIYGAAVSQAAANPHSVTPNLFDVLLQHAVDFPVDIDTTLQEVYAEKLRLKDASNSSELASQRTELIRLNKVILTMSQKGARSDTSKGKDSNPPASLPCFLWLQKKPCDRKCGFYHKFPAHVTPEEQAAYILRASAHNASVPPPVPAPPIVRNRPPTRNSSPARAGPVVDSVDLTTP